MRASVVVFQSWVAVALLVCSCARPPEVELDPGGGLIVESLRDARAAAEAGLEVGDRLLLWQPLREGAPTTHQAFRSPFDLQYIESEESTLGPVRLIFERNGTRRTTTIGYEWGLTARPRFGAELERLYDAALARTEDDPDGAVEALEALASDSEHDVWLLYRAALVRRNADRRDGLGDAYRRAVDAARVRDQERDAGILMFLGGFGLRAVGRWPETAEFFGEAASIFETVGAAGLRAAALDEQGEAVIRLGRREEGVAILQEALESRQQAAPDSLAVASSYISLANLEVSVPERLRYVELALDIHARRAPGSRHHVTSLNNLGNAQWALGDLDGATRNLRAAEALILEQEPDGRRLAMVRGNLALVARARGDLGEAERSLLETLDYFETHEPTSPMTAETYSILGGLRRSLGDLDGARDFLNRALALWQERRPGGEGEISALKSLGDVALREGDLERARERLGAAFALSEAMGSVDDWSAAILVSMANVERTAERFSLASEYLERALNSYREHRPGSQQLAATEISFGHLRQKQERLGEAAAAFRRALDLGERIGPDSMLVARPLLGLAQVAVTEGRIDEALRLYARTIDVLEIQVGRAADTAIGRAQYRNEHRSMYQEYVDLLIRQGLVDRAFAVVERSRAQSFLAMLSERGVDLLAEVPEDLAARRRELDRDYEGLQSRLLRGGSGSEAEQVLSELEELRRRREAVDRQVREASPRLASLSVPESIDSVRAQRALEPGTVALSYSVGDDSTQLLILTPTTLRAVEITVASDELARRVSAFRLLMSAGAVEVDGEATDRATTDPETTRHLFERAVDLYDLLIRPAAPEIDLASRLLVVPDGPLHVLPFAALRSGEVGDSYLIQTHALRLTQSLSAELQLRSRTMGSSRRSSIVAFGDPDPGPVEGAGTESAAARVRASLRPLPGARREVESLHRVFDEALTYVGREASEERVKQLGDAAPYLHFATHAVANEREPLDAGLVLSFPQAPESQENGFLQAWEIFEQLRIEARLVVLSACETGIGADLGADGILGLTRAFQFAGARAVMASLWQVADRSTAPLMVAFYEELDSGRPADAALRAAQLRFLRGDVPEVGRRSLLSRVFRGGDAGVENGGLSHPYHWAGFQLYGALESADSAAEATGAALAGSP